MPGLRRAVRDDQPDEEALRRVRPEAEGSAAEAARADERAEEGMSKPIKAWAVVDCEGYIDLSRTDYVKSNACKGWTLRPGERVVRVEIRIVEEDKRAKA